MRQSHVKLRQVDGLNLWRFDVPCMAFADPCGGCLPIQAQDETEETVSALAEVHAINNAISFGFVPIAPIDVRTGRAALLHCVWVAVERPCQEWCAGPRIVVPLDRQGSVHVGDFIWVSLVFSSDVTSHAGT